MLYQTSSGVLLGVIIVSSTTQHKQYTGTLEEWPRQIFVIKPLRCE